MHHPAALRCTSVVYAKDARRVAEFYRRTLALPIVGEDPSHVQLGDDSLLLSIVQAPGALVADVHIATPPERREATPIKCSFLVDDLARVRADAEATGGGLLPVAKAWDWQGQRHLDGFDPEGNVVQFRVALG